MSGHFRIVESKRASDVVVRVKVDSRNRYGTVFEKADPILATAVNNEVLGSIEIVDKNKKPVEVPFKISAPSIRPTSYIKIILNKANKTDKLQIFDLRLGCLILLFYYV